MLEEAFDTGNTNYTGSVLLTVGDTDDDDRFLTSTELASDGTEVFLKFGRSEAQAPTLSLQRLTPTQLVTNGVIAITYTNIVISDVTNVAVGGITWTAQAIATPPIVTNASATAVQPVVGQQLYTAAKSITCTFTPNADEALADNTAGAVRLYFRVYDSTKLDY